MARFLERILLSLALVTWARLSGAVRDQKVFGGGDFQTFNLPEYPHHSVRIKEQTNDLCNAGSKQYTGWLDTGGKHLFFWYFESLADPENDPLLLWMTGGPGGSGMIGMMMELGPCLVKKNGTGTSHNAYSWTSNASMIFIDQPAGTGFSYGTNDTLLPDNSYDAAADMNVFLRIFYDVFPHFRTLPFHISGESYGGHYIPALAREVLSYNRHPPRPDFRIPLKSILIGNGLVSAMDSFLGFYDTLCTTKPGVPEPVFNASLCQQIAQHTPRCAYLMNACIHYPDMLIYEAAGKFCDEAISDLYFREVHEGGRNPYDISARCEVGPICYGQLEWIDTYMNSKTVRDQLQVPRHVKNFSSISESVNRRFRNSMDGPTSMAADVKYVLEGAIDVLIYNGNRDLVCNTAGNALWTARLPWAGQTEFVSMDMKPWYAIRDGERVVAGKMKEIPAGKAVGEKKAGRFSFVTVDNAGHMVPLDQPQISLQLVQTWLSGEEFDTNMSGKIREETQFSPGEL